MKTIASPRAARRQFSKVLLAVALLPVAGAAVSQEPIRIGAIVSSTGPASFLGDPQEKTLHMSVAKLNAAGGLLGRKVELVLYDDGSDANKANTFAKRLILQDNVDLIIGGSSTGSTMGMVPLVSSSKIPFISLAAATVIVEPVKPYVFKMPHSDRMAAQKVLEDMKKRGFTKFALLSDTGGFGKSGRNETMKLAAAMGMTLSTDQSYGDKDTDMTPQLTKVKSSGAQALFVFGTGQAPAIIARNVQQLGLGMPLYMSHGQASFEFVRIAGKASEGIRMPSPALLVAGELPDADPQKAVSVTYKKEYEERYKTDVSTFGAYAYDGLMIAVDSIKRVGSTDKAKVRDAIEKTTRFVGISGIYNMTPNDHMGLTPAAFHMTEIRGGAFKQLQ